MARLRLWRSPRPWRRRILRAPIIGPLLPRLGVVDGISLTIAADDDEGFTVELILEPSRSRSCRTCPQATRFMLKSTSPLTGHWLEKTRALSVEGVLVMDERIARVEAAIDAMRSGQIVIMVDDEDRENEGDLCMAAQFVTPEAINLMAKEARGLICVTLTAERCQQLELPMMVSEQNGSVFGTNFTVSVEAATGVTTGISAADRATVSVCCNPECGPEDLVKPGHIFPLRAEPGGVLVRTGQTEGSVDLARLAGLIPAAVIVEIMNEDGTMARMPQLESFAERHNMPIVQVADLVHYRLQNESLIERASERDVETRWGRFRAISYASKVGSLEMVAFVLGDPHEDELARVRVHAARLTDTFGGGVQAWPPPTWLRSSFLKAWGGPVPGSTRRAADGRLAGEPCQLVICFIGSARSVA